MLGRDHLDCGSVASPYRETEAMADGSDAIADWPILNALVNTASGASWVSVHHGGGVGIGRSIHAGQVCVADGTDLAAAKLERVLTNDPGMGVHEARRRGIRDGGEGRGRPRRADPDGTGGAPAMKGPGRAGHAPRGPAAAGPGRSGHAPPAPTADWPAGAPDPGRLGGAVPDDGSGTRRWHAELAWLPGGGVQRDVLIEAAGDRFTAVTPGVARGTVPAGTHPLRRADPPRSGQRPLARLPPGTPRRGGGR